MKETEVGVTHSFSQSLTRPSGALRVSDRLGERGIFDPSARAETHQEIHLPAMSPFLPHGHQRLFMGWPWETEGKVLEWLVGSAPPQSTV